MWINLWCLIGFWGFTIIVFHFYYRNRVTDVVGYHVDEVTWTDVIPRPNERQFVVWSHGDITKKMTAHHVLYLDEIPQDADDHPLDPNRHVAARHVKVYPNQFRVLVVYVFKSKKL